MAARILRDYSLEEILAIDIMYIPTFMGVLEIPASNDDRGQIALTIKKYKKLTYPKLSNKLDVLLRRFGPDTPNRYEHIIGVLHDIPPVICQPVIEYITEDRHYRWTIMKKLPVQGALSETWQVCRDESATDCDYILKYIKLPKGSRTSEYFLLRKQKIQREVDIQNMCAKHGICTEIIDAWYCDGGAVIVMRKLDKTLQMLFDEYKSDDIRMMILGSVMGLFNRFHGLNMYHNDIHLDNIMVKSYPMPARIIEEKFRGKTIGEIEKYQIQGYKFYLIDVGGTAITDDKSWMDSDYNNLRISFEKDDGIDKKYELFMKEFIDGYKGETWHHHVNHY